MKVKSLLYCTKAKPYLFNNKAYKTYMEEQGIDEPSFITTNDIQYGFVKDLLNGTIPCECEIEVEEIKKGWGCLNGTRYYRKSSGYPDYELEQKSCLSFDKMNEYLKGTLNEKSGYALHISNLKVFDKPRELSEYCRYDYPTFDKNDIVKTAPQNMCRVLTRNGYAYILISIQPQWLCKILNGEKDIEIRKQVLNCMKEEIK